MEHPKIFISYSHDTPEHRDWVLAIAEKLVAHGIEVLLDMWDLAPGDDVALFMERGLREADRVLMICTTTYVTKAEAGIGGVGYEKIIMTAEYMRNMDSNRVIPIIRQQGTSRVPAFLGTKKYLDFSTDERAELNFDELVRDLHGKPLYEKPRLGAVPNFEKKRLAKPKPETSILSAITNYWVESGQHKEDDFLAQSAHKIDKEVRGTKPVAVDTKDPVLQLDLIRERFFHLMRSHGIDLPAAVELMSPFGFSLSALHSADRMLDLMTPPVFEYLAETFHVSRNWLRGVADQAVKVGSRMQWYKNVPSMAHKLIVAKRAGLRPELLVIRRTSANFKLAFEDNDTGKVPREPVGVVLRLHSSAMTGVNFTTYQVWAFERWNYWRCRTQLKLLIAFCEQFGVYVFGYEISEAAIDQLLAGQKLPVQLLDQLGAVSWYPDDYASFRFEVRHEHSEWISTADEYRDSGLPKLAIDAGASQLPDKPWQPGAQLGRH